MCVCLQFLFFNQYNNFCSFEILRHFPFSSVTHLLLYSALFCSFSTYPHFLNLIFPLLFSLINNPHSLFRNMIFNFLLSFVSFVLYGCESWSLTLREEHRLRVLDNRSLRDDVTGEWRILRNKGLGDMYFSLDNIKVIRTRTMQ